MRRRQKTKNSKVSLWDYIPTRSIFEKLRSLLVLSNKISAQKGIPEKIRHSQHLLNQYSHEELVLQGEKVLKNVEEAKKEFLERTGKAGEGFLARSVLPTIHSLENLIQCLRKAPLHEEVGDMKAAVSAVELVALTQDPYRPWHKVREATVCQARVAIVEDVAFLRAYPGELLTSMGILGIGQTSYKRTIERALKPVLKKIGSLVNREPISNNFYDLYSWRQAIDDERQQLHDIALQYIDEIISV